MKSSWGEVYNHTILRADEAAVDHRTFDAMRALLDRLLRQADEERFWQRAGRDVDFHFDRKRVDAEERKGVELGEHAP